MTPRLLVCAPLRVEALALRAGPARREVRRTGYGPVRSACRAARLAEEDADAFAVAGFAGGLGSAVRSGDVIVASEVRGPHGAVPCPSARLLAEEVGRGDLLVHCGPVVSTGHVVSDTERAVLAASGALGVDMESLWLARAAAGRPLAVVRVVVDTADEPLAGVGTVRRGIKALCRLRELGPALDRWARAVCPEPPAGTADPATGGNVGFGIAKEVPDGNPGP
ncbi:hypothetical protein HUO13_17410 [Saccharopolyspora erythraea]|uniref:phosphorylase family protein n=1 Tax=Saccharopolyspora erythraea TaxID=1836 RepID=UPI001BA4F7FE|nr:hypothetical protein [Saccharopolyspora erythraea]QUH02341.1 hypothetical protein HUO13_17410 [Saccharopolyspora erythraea]